MHALTPVAVCMCMGMCAYVQGGSGKRRLRLLSRFWNDRDRNDMVACGAAAGVAAAFRRVPVQYSAPLGGPACHITSQLQTCLHAHLASSKPGAPAHNATAEGQPVTMCSM